MFVVIQMDGKLIVEISGTLKLTCNASGGSHPLDNINWFKDGNAIERDKLNRKIEITESYSIAQKTIQKTPILDSNSFEKSKFVNNTY
ncbi:hypothetical protein KUTeg_018208 [Tegillarca granosa]|uniref:Ig-like domain-containing protein n=1 Tax=Tegillarca granosa TaxID=220873 RepID=A0ABQ9EHD8_TEGGR|nr:hypothetical protein KUTeg_018208 [Tegillarca granosa]